MTCDRSFTLTRFHSPVRDVTEAGWETPQCQGSSQAGAADNAQAKQSYAISGQGAKLDPAGNVTGSDKWKERCGDDTQGFCVGKQQKCVLKCG